MSTAPGPGPLAGVRVVDITRFPPGTYCTVLLADLGAEVYRIDAPGSNPMAAGVGVGLSRGKRSIGLDLRHPRGNEVLRRLAAWADVLVENNRPGDMDKRGFGYSHAAIECPRLIWCSITGFGQDGPYATRPGHDLTYTAHAGLLAALGPPLPWQPQTTLAVPLGAMMAATGIAAALVERNRSGRGCQIDVSLAEAATWLLSGNDGELADSSWGIPSGPDRRLYQCRERGVHHRCGRRASHLGCPMRRVGAARPGGGRPAPTRPGRGGHRQAGGRVRHSAGGGMGPTPRAAECGHRRSQPGLRRRAGPPRPSPGQHHRDCRAIGARQPDPMRDLEGPRSGSATSPPAEVGSDTVAALAAAGYSDTEIEQLRSDAPSPGRRRPVVNRDGIRSRFEPVSPWRS